MTCWLLIAFNPAKSLFCILQGFLICFTCGPNLMPSSSESRSIAAKVNGEFQKSKVCKKWWPQ